MPTDEQNKPAGAQSFLTDKLDADKRDAERYRWLRKQHWSESGMGVVAHPKSAVKLGYDCPSLDRLDAQIDACMQIDAMQAANGTEANRHAVGVSERNAVERCCEWLAAYAQF